MGVYILLWHHWLPLHSTSDAGGAERSLSILISSHETLSTKQLESLEEKPKMLKANMSKLIMELK